MKRRLCALALALCVAVTSVPMTALAEEGDAAAVTTTTVQETEEETQVESDTQTEDQSQTDAEPGEEQGDVELEELIEERTGSLEPVKELTLTEDIVSERDEEEVDKLERQSASYASSAYKSYWDSYSSNYIYNHLSKEERDFWDAMDNACYYYLTNNVDAKVYAVRDKYGNIVNIAAAEGNYWVNKSALVPSRVFEIFMMFNYSNPQYYFLDGSMLTSGDYAIPGFYMEFQKGSVRSAETAVVKAQVDAWETEIARGATEELKAKIAHDLIVEKVRYDYGYETAPQNPFHQSAYSVFTKDYTVCAGYAKAFEMLMNGAGVDTMAVTSDDHAWNIVNINDSWYHMDCTWDDQDDNGGWYYWFFNRSYSMLMGLSGGQGESHVPESFYNGVIPNCTLDSGANQDSIGACWVPSAVTAVPGITAQTADGKVQLNISSATPGAEIYFTRNGETPSSNYTRSEYFGGTVELTENTFIRAMAAGNSYWDSGISEAQINVCKITFDSNGGSSVEPQYAVYNTPTTKPTDPTRNGYAFGGWYVDAGCSKAYDFNTILTGDITLYAKWMKMYTVKFNANGGSVKPSSKQVAYGEKYGTLPSPKKKGYTFSGWYTKKTGGTKVTASSKVKITKTTTLYAHWKKTSVKATSISKLKNQKGKILKVTAKKVSGADGYQVRYSTKSNMKSAKKKAVKNSRVVTVSKLKKGKKYYVQVRAYKVDSAGKKVYSKWSGTKSIKIKK